MQNTSMHPAEEIERVLSLYGDRLYRLCFLMLQNSSDAEDVIQETILKYYQKAPAFENAEHEKAWLMKVAANKCRDLLRWRVRHPLAEEREAVLPPAGTDSGILEALASLPEKYRLVLTLYYIEDCRIEEIAGIIRRTPSAVKMRLQKGRRLLEAIYRKEYL